MKRALALALASALFLPALACQPKKPEVDIQAEIARNLEEAASNLRNNKLDEAKGQYGWVLEHVRGLQVRIDLLAPFRREATDPRWN